MATPSDLQSILAALAATGATPQPPVPQQGYPPPPMPQGVSHGYGNPAPGSAPPAGMPPYGLPHATGGGSFNLNDMRPSASGGIDLNSIKPAQIGSLGLPPHDRSDPRMSHGYRRSRSRSRSPPRNSSYNPYRDERRGGGGYNGYGAERPRSRSPSRRNDNFSPAMGRGRERSPPRRAGGSEDSEIITMDPSVVGLVIGRQGENLKRIEKTTGCKIQFITGPDGGSTRRQCRIDGPFRAREDAKREIFRTIDENERGKQQQTSSRGSGGAYSTQGSEMPELRPGELSQQMMVPDKTVGLIIGRGGETIRDLQEKSACHINIVGENKSIGGLRPVNLIGTPQAAEHAKALIMEIVASDERPENQRAPGRQPAAAQQYSAPPQDQGKINESIHVPSEAVGMIIGKGGETIKNMQNDTGCKINVSQPSGPDYEREIGLIGTRQAIEAAKRAIWEKVDTVREKSGGGDRGGNRRDGGGGGGGYNDRYSQPQQQQPSYAQPPVAQAGQMPPAGAPAGDDPYAPWGGYSGYVAWYYSNMLQGGQAPGGPPAAGGPTRPPGA